MGGFFYKLGRSVGPNLRKANWLFHSLTGSEADAVRAEYAVGRDLAQAYGQQVEIEQDPAIVQGIEDLGQRLAACVPERAHRFQFRVVRATEINALAMPGGFIFVMRPLLQLCQWDANEIAFVVGHEMAHVLRRHAIDRLMASSLIRGGTRHLPVGGLLKAPLVQMATALLNQGYSQDSELEADELGVRLARAAGYEAAAAVRLLHRLRTIPSEAWLFSTYLSSHPPIDVRVRQVERLLK